MDKKYEVPKIEVVSFETTENMMDDDVNLSGNVEESKPF